jgi:hypothetical protein
VNIVSLSPPLPLHCFCVSFNHPTVTDPQIQKKKKILVRPFRLLAHAGFDPRRAVRFWEDRTELLQASECVASAAVGHPRRREDQQSRNTFALRIVGSGHPVNEVRVEKLREELDRWRAERERVLAELEKTRRGSIDAHVARS